MTLKLNNKKRNPSTGKLQNTGTQTTVGLVSRGAAGGYSQGPINPGMVPVKTNPSGQQYYGYPQPQNIVPNNQPQIPASLLYTPAPSATIPASFEPNFSLSTGGAAYASQPVQGQQTITPAGQPVPARTSTSSSSKTSSPAPTSTTPSVTLQPSAQGSSSNPPVATRPVVITDKNGVSRSYDIDPRYSVISQTGSYEHPFWTSEGQAERIKNALETASFRTTSTGFAGQSSPVAGAATTAAIDVLNVASIFAGATAVFKSIASWNKLGALAAAPGGAETIASTLPQAAGASSTAGVGTAAANTKNFATGIKALLNLKGTNGLIKLSAVGYLINKSLSGAEKINNEKTNFAEESGQLALDLLDAGMVDEANELYTLNEEISDAGDNIGAYIPYLGQPFVSAEIERDKRILNEYRLRYQAKKNEMLKTELLKQEEAKQQAEITKREQQLQDEQRKREQDLQDRATQREQQLTDRADARAYEQQRTSLEYQQQAQLDAIATQSSEGSTLTFGLLGTGGATEFVDKDRAAQYYFKSNYEELTPAQKLLLNLLKGGN